MHPIDLAVAALSACQFGVFSRTQVLEGLPAERRTLSVPHGTSRSNPLAQVFQTRDLPATTRIDGLPVASVERILADVSPFVGERMLEELVERARLAGHTNPVRLRRELARLTTSGRDLRRFRAQVEQALRHGYPTVRYAYEDLVADPDGVEAEVLDILGLSER